MAKISSQSSNEKRARLLAFYLPQFHPIPENDEWWGKGFTEWTNVTKAKPLFRGHEQPKLPSELGFYDLRVPETREAQAALAKDHGIEGFCYWHYWFSGKRLLERPFNEVLKSGKPNFPFCLAWANATWAGIWHGAPDKILIKQEYPGKKDYEEHFYALLGAFQDDRYIIVDGKPVFILFRPQDLPDPIEFTDLWRNLAVKSGLKGIYFIGIQTQMWNPVDCGFDACCVDYFSTTRRQIDNLHRSFLSKVFKQISGKDFKDVVQSWFSKPAVYSYKDIIKNAFHTGQYNDFQYPCLIPNWDNTPRSNNNGVIFEGARPDLFKTHLKKALSLIENRTSDKKVVFIKSWNEWAEGNILEPDQRFGRRYLEVIKEEIDNLSEKNRPFPKM